MRFINCLAIAIALAVTAASAAPVIESIQTLTATLDEGHLAYPEKTETMEKRFYRSFDTLLEARPKKAETAENTRGNRYENPSDREDHSELSTGRS